MNEHTINNPLRLYWAIQGYKVNKPGIDDEELVSKLLAEELLEALRYAVDILPDGGTKEHCIKIIKLATK